MRLSMLVLICILIYGIFFVWPMKMALFKKLGRIASNTELNDLAKAGDPDCLALKKKTLPILYGGVICALIYMAEKIFE